MIVHRSVFNVKMGSARKAMELLSRPRKQLGIPYRALYSEIGPGLTVAIEVEFENYAELEKGLPEFQRSFFGSLTTSDDEDVSARAMFREVFESWHSRELWRVIE